MRNSTKVGKLPIFLKIRETHKFRRGGKQACDTSIDAEFTLQFKGLRTRNAKLGPGRKIADFPENPKTS